MVRWVSKSNDDSLWGVIDSLNGGKFKDGHDNLQQFNLTRTHRFNEAGTLLTSTEAYYIFQTHALIGGTVNNGPSHSWFQNVCPGAPIPGNRAFFRNKELTSGILIASLSAHQFLQFLGVSSTLQRDLGSCSV
jgi:hypothetical protein